MADLFLGIDLGTSGARAVAIDGDGEEKGDGRVALSSDALRDPNAWWDAVATALDHVLDQCGRGQVKGLAVSATSGTVLAVDGQDSPLQQVFLYSDPCPDEAILARVRRDAPDWTPARGGTGGLACALHLAAHHPTRVVHQADWINHHLTGAWVGDSSSSLKSGYDPRDGRWPDWVTSLGLGPELRCDVRASGSLLGTIGPNAAKRFGLANDVAVIAGTTDGCASFLASGASKIGEAVTVLGTTLTIKLLSDTPIFEPAAGVYSHLIAGQWLVGGASNSGGGVLLNHFSLQQISDLSDQIDGREASGLDYYPLSKPGERFPIADPEKAPRLSPRPEDDALFLHGMLDGLGAVEAAAYEKLADMGAPQATQIYATGGGTKNPAWMAVRERLLPAPLAQPASTEAAYGTALLVRRALT